MAQQYQPWLGVDLGDPSRTKEQRCESDVVQAMKRISNVLFFLTLSKP